MSPRKSSAGKAPLRKKTVCRIKFEVLWAAPAVDDLTEILEYIRRKERPATARKILQEIKKIGDRLKDFPGRGRIVPELLRTMGIQQYRELIHKRWRMIYRIEAARVYVLRVIDSSRNLEDLLLISGLRDRS